MPHRTRLSRGQNNGDRSWSLSLDDLDGLNYLAPQDLRGTQTLSIRVVSLDGGDGATVAVLEHSIPAVDGPAPAASPKVVSSSSRAVDDTLAVRLREELDKLRAINSAQEAALLQMRQSIESDWETKAQDLLDSELKTARRNWDEELKKKLAEASKRSAAEVEQLRQAAREERDARLAEAETLAASQLQQERKRWQKEADAALAAAEKNWRAAEEKSRTLSSQLDAKDRSQKDFETLLVKAEKSWKDGEAKRLADAETQWQARTAKEAAELRAKVESECKTQEDARLSTAKSEWQTNTERALADALARSTQESNAALISAQEAWKSDETKRLAAAETKWREQTERLVAEARAQASLAGKANEQGQLSQLRAELATASKAFKDRGDELTGVRRALEEAQLRLQREAAGKAEEAILLKQLREDLAGATNRAKDRENELANVRLAAEAAQLRLQRDGEAALSQAQEKWAADEAERTAAADRIWQERVASHVAEARAQALAMGKADESSQISQLREELTSISKTLADRDSDLAQLRRLSSEASDRLPQQIAIALSDAQKIWAREETARLAEAESKWRERSEKEISEARAAASAVPDNSAELARLRGELESLRQTLVERDSELARVQLAHENTSDATRENSEAALAEAKSAWAAAEAARLAAAEEAWREQAQGELATATQRYKQAEAELAETMARGGEARSPRDKVEILRLREEVENLKSTVAIRDVELSQAHSTAEQMRKRLDMENEEILPGLNRGRRMSDRVRRSESDETAKHPIWRDIALVAALAAFGILLYPRIVALVPDDWWPASSYSDDSTPDPAPRRSAPAPAAVPPTDIVAHAANVRSGPTKTASVVATLDRDVGVWTIEKKGSWIHITFLAGDAKKHDGWVFNTFLKPAPAAAATPAPGGSH